MCPNSEPLRPSPQSKELHVTMSKDVYKRQAVALQHGYQNGRQKCDKQAVNHPADHRPATSAQRIAKYLSLIHI